MNRTSPEAFEAALQPYVRSDPTRPPSAQAGMADNPNWSAFYLWTVDAHGIGRAAWSV